MKVLAQAKVDFNRDGQEDDARLLQQDDGRIDLEVVVTNGRSMVRQNIAPANSEASLVSANNSVVVRSTEPGPGGRTRELTIGYQPFLGQDSFVAEAFSSRYKDQFGAKKTMELNLLTGVGKVNGEHASFKPRTLLLEKWSEGNLPLSND